MKTRIIANYLPQYHQIPENNLWWGEGYTDWVAVKKNTPIFKGHRQPRVPLEGYYDLSKKEDIKKQAEMAQKFGIDGFGIYHYWFSSNQKLLTKPAELILENPDINIEYLFIWDNGTWKKTWSKVKGPSNDWAPRFEKKEEKKRKDRGILAELVYGDEEEWRLHFEFLLPYFSDFRYIKIDNKPVFVIFHQDNNSKVLYKMFKYWDLLARKKGFNGMYIIGQENSNGVHICEEEFKYQPQWDGWANKNILDKIKNKIFENKKLIYDYDQIWERILKNAQKDVERNVNFGAFVDYDDSPRRGENGKVFVGSTPEKFYKYIREIIKLSNLHNKNFLFITAWNEWGEGAYLEPDTEMKYSYLEALKNAVNDYGNINIQEIKVR